MSSGPRAGMSNVSGNLDTQGNTSLAEGKPTQAAGWRQASLENNLSPSSTEDREGAVARKDGSRGLADISTHGESEPVHYQCVQKNLRNLWHY